MRAAVRRVNGGAALFLLRLPPIPASRRGSSSYAALQSAYGGHKRANRPGSQDPPREVELTGRRGRLGPERVTSAGGGPGERRIRRSARPAPRAAACPRRPAHRTPWLASSPYDESRVGEQASAAWVCALHRSVPANPTPDDDLHRFSTGLRPWRRRGSGREPLLSSKTIRSARRKPF
jgi:hypothetical protein